MKVLLYVNKEKDASGKYTREFLSAFSKYKIEYQIISDENLKENISADGLFSFGGDGTILGLVEFSIKNSIPIIGINAGKLGFLTEFETNEINFAIKLFVENALKEDRRSTLKINYDGKNYFGLNDAVVQRVFTGNGNGMIVKLSAFIDDEKVDSIEGDGVIVATPTGSTAYSLSAGGAILAPRINAYLLTPIAAHSLTHRPIIYSSDSVCRIYVDRGKNTGLFVDGNFLGILSEKDFVTISKFSKQTVFLRKSDSNFYKRLSDKLKREGKCND